MDMIYYSFYLNKEKTQLVYRTTGGHSTSLNDMFNQEETKPLIFESHDACMKDFMHLLWDNEDYRYGQTFGLKKEKKTKEKKVASISFVEKPVKPELPVFVNVPEINTVYNEDCLKTMARMPSGFVDHIITSPPYNAEKRISCGEHNAIYIGNEEMYSDYEDNLTPEQYEEWLFEVIRECIRVVKYHVFFNIQMLSKNKRTVLKIHGVFSDFIKDKMIWNKSIASPNIVPGIMRSKYEDIFIFSNENPESRDFKDGEFSGSFSNVIEGVNSSRNKHSKINKATFPTYLPRTFMLHFCQKGQLIYDPFNGTGTTGDACVIEGMNYIGSELDPRQCEITNRRIKDQSAKLTFKFG